MKILSFLADKLITPAYAQLTGELTDDQMTCYLTGPVDPVVQTEKIVSIILYNIIAPIGSFILAIIHALRLLKKSSFNIYSEVYRGFLRTLILAISFWLVTGILDSIYQIYPMEGDWSQRLIIILISTCFAAGLGYLIISLVNKKIFIMAISFILILPTLYVFIFVLGVKLIPSLRQYAPQGVIEVKKEKLTQKLKDKKILKK